MERELKTLSRRDPLCTQYLDGSFSDTLVALPIKSLNVDTVSEEITFEILPFDRISRPSIFHLITVLLRPTTLAFSAAPMLTTLAMISVHDPSSIRWNLTVGAFLGVIAFHFATNLFNDYGDHMRGQDRMRLAGGGRPIQRGWVRAFYVKRAAIGLAGLALLCGLPALLLTSTSVAIIAAIALLLGLELAFQKLKLKRRGWAEVLAFLLTGPLLTGGIAWAATGSVRFDMMLLGCVFGSAAMMYFHAVNFENIMPDSQAGVRTWATRTGFDASKKFFYFTAALGLAFLFSYILLAVVFAARDLRLAPAFAVQLGFLVPVCRRVHAIASPLSSDLVGLRNDPILLSWLTAITLSGAAIVGLWL